MGKLKLGYDKLPLFKELDEEIKNNFKEIKDVKRRMGSSLAGRAENLNCDFL